MQAEDFAKKCDERLYHAWRAAGILADLMLFYFDKDYEVEIDPSQAIDPGSYPGMPLSEHPSAIKLAVDLMCNQMARDYLGKLYPDYGFVGEESFDKDPGQLEKELFWVVDPICGSKGYRNKTTSYGASVALVSREKGPILGVLSCPGMELSAMGDAEKGLYWLQGGFRGREPRGLNLAISGNQRKNPAFQRVIDELRPARVDYYTGVPPKTVQVIGGAYDLYFSLARDMGGNSIKIWDLAASWAIARAKGMAMRDARGNELDLSGKSGHLFGEGYVLARDQRVMDLVMAAIAKVFG